MAAGHEGSSATERLLVETWGEVDRLAAAVAVEGREAQPGLEPLMSAVTGMLTMELQAVYPLLEDEDDEADRHTTPARARLERIRHLQLQLPETPGRRQLEDYVDAVRAHLESSRQEVLPLVIGLAADADEELAEQALAMRQAFD